MRLADLSEERSDLVVDFEYRRDRFALLAAHGQVAREQVAVFDDAVVGVEQVTVSQLTRDGPVSRCQKARVGAFVVADLRDVRRIHGASAQVVDLDLGDPQALQLRRQRGRKLAAGRVRTELVVRQRVGVGEIRLQLRPQRIGQDLRQRLVMGFAERHERADRDLAIQHPQDRRHDDDGDEARNGKVA